MLTNLVREFDDHDLSVLHTRNTQNGLVGVACVNPLHKKISRPALGTGLLSMTAERAMIKLGLKTGQAVCTESRSKRQFGSLFFIPFILGLLSRSTRDRE